MSRKRMSHCIWLIVAAAICVIAAIAVLGQEVQAPANVIAEQRPPRQYPAPSGLPIRIGKNGLLEDSLPSPAPHALAMIAAATATVTADGASAARREPSAKPDIDYCAATYFPQYAPAAAYYAQFTGYEWLKKRCDVLNDFHHQNTDQEVLFDITVWLALQVDQYGYPKYDSPAAMCSDFVDFHRPHLIDLDGQHASVITIRYTLTPVYHGKYDGERRVYVGAACETCTAPVQLPCTIRPYWYEVDWTGADLWRAPLLPIQSPLFDEPPGGIRRASAAP